MVIFEQIVRIFFSLLIEKIIEIENSKRFPCSEIKGNVDYAVGRGPLKTANVIIAFITELLQGMAILTTMF